MTYGIESDAILALQGDCMVLGLIEGYEMELLVQGKTGKKESASCRSRVQCKHKSIPYYQHNIKLNIESYKQICANLYFGFRVFDMSFMVNAFRGGSNYNMSQYVYEW